MLKEIVWTGKNRISFEKELMKLKEKFEFIVEEIKGKEETNCYIDSLGGFINYNSTLFIYENRIYLKKD